MKKIIVLFLIAVLVVACSACAGKRSEGNVEGPKPENTPTPQAAALKLGLGAVTDMSGSTDATDKEGAAAASMTFAAVTVDGDGVITACELDGLNTSVAFTKDGKVSGATGTKTKNELGDDYGMKKASSIGREWYEQAQAFAQYAEGKTVKELKGMSLTEDGAPAEADISASVTLSVGGFLTAIEKAAENAKEFGIGPEDELRLAASVKTDSSADATSAADGRAAVSVTLCAATFGSDNRITGCVLDEIEASADFDAAGMLTGDREAEVRSKNELGDAYGMKQASSIGREWYEQAAAFAKYCVGKTADEVKGIPMKDNKADDPDLVASVTIHLDEFIYVVDKAANKGAPDSLAG